MGMISIVIGAFLAGALLTALPRVPRGPLRGLVVTGALVAVVAGILLSSIRFVPEDRLGVVVRNALGPKLPPGKIIATEGEMGPQARILPPGWHLGFWPVIYDIELYPVVVVPAGQVGLLRTADGMPLPPGQIYAPEWQEGEFGPMLDAEHFLTEGGGNKGPQAAVLTPGTYRLNPKLFAVSTVPVTNIPPASVGVVKSNVGALPALGASNDERAVLVDRGQRGVWREHLPPAEYYLNREAYEVAIISTRATIVQYTTARPRNTPAPEDEEREISVRSADGFTFPVDVRVEYVIDPEDAPLVVATLRDQDGLLTVLNSAVRAIFRNSAERVKALDYVQQRSQQERQALEALGTEMVKYGVRITAVRIGDIGNQETLGLLLKTQTDREIALQEQLTLQEQQRAAEERKALTRTVQEAEEERRLATARYEVKIADESRQRVLIEAAAEAEAIRIRAEAQAGAFQAIAQQIGSGNTALMELLRIVGERGIQITPRVMVTGGQGSTNADAQTVALIGTMLDSLVSREEPTPAETRPGTAPGEAAAQAR